MQLHVLWPEQRVREHITSVLRSWHWLLVTKRIEYKIISFTDQCVHKTTPQNLQELVCQHSTSRSLRPSSLCRLSVSGFAENTMTKQNNNNKHSGARSFRSAAAPNLWNRLPDKLHQANNIASSWQQLKSHFIFNFVIPSSHTPPPPPSFPSTTSMWFSCMESDCALQVEIDMVSSVKNPSVTLDYNLNMTHRNTEHFQINVH